MPEPLKERYNQVFITDLSQRFTTVWSPFETDRFEKLVFDKRWEALELKERMRQITTALHAVLPESYPEAINILIGCSDSCTPDFLYAFFPDFVELYGMHDWETSVPALAALTPSSSSEFAVRPYIKADAKRMMAQMQEWTEHENFHVRRLASEGCRPRLPWAMALPDFKADPSPILPILEALKADSSEYVRRSVANNLNDISKDHPNQVLAMGKAWLGHAEDVDKVVKHACRSLLKQGDREALMLFGFADPKALKVSALTVREPVIQIGDDQYFQFTLHNEAKKSTKVRLEYKVTYQKARNKQSEKVFQISEKVLEPGQHQVERKQAFRNFSTRKHYPGTHTITVVVNGANQASVQFELEV